MGKLFLLITVLISSFSAYCQPITSAQIDALVEQTLKTFDVPGIAVAVVKDGKIIHAKGYGVRSLRTMQKMDENTLFGIASNSKAFTTAALGMLKDEGKIAWDTKVTDIIPEFKLYDPYVTAQFTIRDLLCHRSGLGLGAGDLMFWPGNTKFDIKDVIHNLRYLKPVSSFRTKYDYDNLLYIVAGEVVARVSGTSWENFIETRILQPMGMVHSAAAYDRLKDTSDVMEPHAPVSGKVQVIGRDINHVVNAAGGIYSSVSDMCNWAIMQMNNGKYGDGLTKQLFSENVHTNMWTPQTIIPINDTSIYRSHFASYGLGWGLRDIRGYKQVSHTGGLAGIVTQVTLLPELKLGIIVFTNQQSGEAFTAITNTIKDSYWGIKDMNWLNKLKTSSDKNQLEAKNITDKLWQTIDSTQKNSTIKPDLNLYVGTYEDVWFGKILITKKDNQLYFTAEKSPSLTGKLLYYKGNTLIAKWDDRSLDADAYVIFQLDKNGKTSGVKMAAISPLTDFSFDFQDLDFNRVD